jgi:hypothetical protein
MLEHSGNSGKKSNRTLEEEGGFASVSQACSQTTFVISVTSGIALNVTYLVFFHKSSF